MPSETSHESELGPNHNLISENASDWIQQFVKHLEISLIDSTSALPHDAGISEYHEATVHAMLQTLWDSGMDADTMKEAIGQFLIDQQPGSADWNAELNQRRFELIEKEIQDSLTLGEQIELAGLTRIMREQVDSEQNLPIEGANALYRKLLEQSGFEKPR